MLHSFAFHFSKYEERPAVAELHLLDHTFCCQNNNAVLSQTFAGMKAIQGIEQQNDLLEYRPEQHWKDLPKFVKNKKLI